MKILYLSPAPLPPTAHPDGACTHIREVVRALERRGHQVRLVAGTGATREALLTPAPPAFRRVVPRPLRNLRREWLERRHDGQVFAHALRAALEFGPDLIYERAAILHLSGARLARALRLPLIVEQNSPQVEERAALTGMALPGLAARIDRTTCQAADAVVTVSTAMREHLISMGVRPDTTYVVPNAARTDLFDPHAADGAAVRRQFQVPVGAVVAGFVGAFADWHGLDGLVRAFSLAQGNAPADLYLMLVGDGPHRPSLEAMARDLDVRARVRFTGSVPFESVPDYLAAMDIAVMPSSNWYGSPIKIFEYGAMGRAVIAPDTLPVREVMADDEEGLIVPPGSVEALRAALHRLAGSRPLREQLGERFRARVLRQYTWSQVADRLLSICSEALEQRTVGSRRADPEGLPYPASPRHSRSSGTGGRSTGGR